MKAAALLLLCLFGAMTLAAEPEKKQFLLYAQFLQETPVELSDGTKWVMDAGDCFPIYMFKENQTKVVLQLGSASFRTETVRVKILKEADAPRALQSYRKTLESYLNSKAEHWKQDAR